MGRNRACLVLVFLILWLIPSLAWAQQEVRSSTKGASTPLPITGSVVDADHNALDVKCLSGCAGGGGGGDASAANQTTEITSLQLIDDAIATTGSAITTKGMAVSGTDGTNARVLKTDASGELQVDVLTLPTLPAGTNAIGKLSANSGVDIGDVDVTSVTPGTTASSLGKAEDAAHASGDVGVMMLCVRAATATDRSVGATDGDYEPCAVDASGRIHTFAAQAGTWTVQPGNTANTTPWLATISQGGNSAAVTASSTLKVTNYDSSGNEIVVPTAGLTGYTAAGASTNATSVKGSAGTLYGLSLSNTTTTVYYLRLYNLSSAPTCSSATGYVSSIPIPPAAASGQVGGREIQYNIGKAFTTGIAFCVTGGASSTDNTNAATGVFVESLYK